MKTLADRLKHAMKLREIRYRKDLASMAGVSAGAVTQWFTGDTASLAADPLMKLAKGLHVRAEWLRDGTGAIENGVEEESPFDDFAMLRHLDVKASAGNGNLVFVESEKGRLAFRKDFLRHEGIKETEAVVIYANGQSMEPTIPDGAVLLVNLEKTELSNNDIYVIRVDDEIFVKRLRKEIGGGVIIVSDNPDKHRYPDILVPPDKEDHITIIGRVFWMGARI